MSVKDKAAEFGRGVNAPSGRRLWWLAWSSTYTGRKPGRPKNDSRESFPTGDDERVSQREFAKLAECSQTQVSRILSAGKLMQEDGLLPKDDEKDEYSEWDNLASAGYMVADDECEDAEQHWSHYYRMAKYGRPEPEPSNLVLIDGGKRNKPPADDDDFEKPRKRREAEALKERLALVSDETPASDESQEDSEPASSMSRLETLRVVARAAHSIKTLLAGCEADGCDDMEREVLDKISSDLTEAHCSVATLLDREVVT